MTLPSVALALVVGQLAVVAAAILVTLPCAAQVSGKLPPPSRTVFKCEVGGKVVYSDEPCLGAKRVDVEPTRGMDSLSGKARTGQDVRSERFNEQLAGALQPLTGETPEQFEVRRRRVYLQPAAQRECRTLDVDVARLERDERVAPAATRADTQRKLLASRMRQRELRC